MKRHAPHDVWKFIDIKDNDECWEWKGCIGTGGYGSFMMGCKSYSPHRIVYAIVNPGKIEFKSSTKNKDSLYVLHKCDNRKCCNPSHLDLGTQKENMEDMVKKGRGPSNKGNENPNAKLDSFMVEDIRWLHKNGMKLPALARIYEVSWSCVNNVVCGRTWRV